ncbi:MAG: PaaI family thioesterase [Clostridiales bacterium]|nr:PaaI family thioesterase [Clostridiales bacterium]
MGIKYDYLVQKRNTENSFGKELGIQVLDIQEGYAKSELCIEKRHVNNIGSVHGGVIFTMADSCAGAASWSYGNYATTMDCTINYLNAAINSKKLIAEAKVVKHGKRIMVIQVEIVDETEEKKAIATFSFCQLNQSIF